MGLPSGWTSVGGPASKLTLGCASRATFWKTARDSVRHPTRLGRIKAHRGPQALGTAGPVSPFLTTRMAGVSRASHHPERTSPPEGPRPWVSSAAWSGHVLPPSQDSCFRTDAPFPASQKATGGLCGDRRLLCNDTKGTRQRKCVTISRHCSGGPVAAAALLCSQGVTHTCAQAHAQARNTTPKWRLRTRSVHGHRRDNCRTRSGIAGVARADARLVPGLCPHLVAKDSWGSAPEAVSIETPGRGARHTPEGKETAQAALLRPCSPH